MAEANEYYYCEICGIVLRTLKGGAGTLVCCGQDMTKVGEAEARKMAAE
jgi:superoxide reductase